MKGKRILKHLSGLFISFFVFIFLFSFDWLGGYQQIAYNVKGFMKYFTYKKEKFSGDYYGKRFSNRKSCEYIFYDLMLINSGMDEENKYFKVVGREEVKKDLVDVMILLKKYKMAGYVIESEIKEVVDKDRYLEKYTPLLSYIYYKVGDKDKSDKYLSEFISHLKGIRNIEEEREEIEKKRNEVLKKKGRYFKYKKDYYDFLLKRLKGKEIFS